MRSPRRRDLLKVTGALGLAVLVEDRGRVDSPGFDGTGRPDSLGLR